MKADWQPDILVLKKIIYSFWKVYRHAHDKTHQSPEDNYNNILVIDEIHSRFSRQVLYIPNRIILSFT